MRHLLIGQHRPIERTHHLTHIDQHLPVARFMERNRRDSRIDLAPLLGSVSAHRVVDDDEATLEGARPMNVRRHQRQRGIDVARIEGGINGAAQDALATPAAWLTTVVQHRSIDSLRKRTRDAAAARDAVEPAQSAPQPDDGLTRRADLGAALARMRSSVRTGARSTIKGPRFRPARTGWCRASCRSDAARRSCVFSPAPRAAAAVNIGSR